MKTIAIGFLTQILLSVGSIVAAGFFIHACKQLFIRACGKYAPQIVNYSGIIGTPVHELSHAAMCLLFGHKIKKIKLFGIDKRRGTLGYVQHSFNPHSIRQRIGNFFIGIAPVAVGSGVIMLLMRLLLPSVFGEVAALMRTAAEGTLSLSALAQLAATTGGIFKAIFNPADFGNWKLWVFILISLTIAVHMELSTADIKGGLNGFLFFAGTFLLIDIALFFINPTWLSVFTNAVVSGSFFMISVLLLSMVFAGTIGIISLLILALKKIF